MARRTKAEVSVLDVLDGPFAAAFPRETWAPWRAFLAAAFGLGLEGEALELYRAHTGRTDPPAAPAKEVWCVAGRRGGKSRVAALVAVYLSCFRRYRLAPGETGTLMVIAVDKTQAKVVFSYIRALVAAVPMLARMVTGETAESIELANRTRIEVRAGSFRSVRGASVIAAILDEVAFMRDEAAAEPDIELYRALKPAMATTGGLLIGISSPYARRGLLWQKFRAHYGKDGDVLVWRAPSLAMNPTLPAEVVGEALTEDPEAAKAEWLGEFRSDLEAFVSREVVEACTVADRHELPPQLGVTYMAFVDPSGGSADEMTLAIAHGDNGVAALDAVRARRPPFSPEDVVAEFCGLLRAYGCTSVVGDRYGGEWPRERFGVHGVHYEPSERTKSDIYRNLLPLLNGARCELLDHPKLAAQLCSLERRTARGGRDSIDHGPGGHDDVANAASGALLLASAQAVGEPWGARLSPTPTGRVIDEETRERYWPSATGFDSDPLHDRDYDDLHSEFRRNGW